MTYNVSVFLINHETLYPEPLALLKRDASSVALYMIIGTPSAVDKTLENYLYLMLSTMVVLAIMV